MLLNQSRLRTRHEATINQVITLLHKGPAASLQMPWIIRSRLSEASAADCSSIPAKPEARAKLLPEHGQQPLPLQLQSHRPEPLAPGHPLRRPTPSRKKPSPNWSNFSPGAPGYAAKPPPKPGELLWAIEPTCTSPNCPLPSGQSWKPATSAGWLVAQLTYRNQHLGYLSIFRQAINVEFIWAGRLDSTDPRQQRPRQSFETWRELKQGQAQPWTEEEVELAQTLACNFAQVNLPETALFPNSSPDTELEGRVQQRTAGVAKKPNTNLKREVEERENALRQLQLARDSLKRLSYQNELILKSAGEGICSLDLEGKITSANPTAARILGYSTKKMVGQLIHTLVEPTKADKSSYEWEQSPIFKTLTEGTTQQGSEDLFSPPQRRIFSGRIHVYFHPRTRQHSGRGRRLQGHHRTTDESNVLRMSLFPSSVTNYVPLSPPFAPPWVCWFRMASPSNPTNATACWKLPFPIPIVWCGWSTIF